VSHFFYDLLLNFPYSVLLDVTSGYLTFNSHLNFNGITYLLTCGDLNLPGYCSLLPVLPLSNQTWYSILWTRFNWLFLIHDNHTNRTRPILSLPEFSATPNVFIFPPSPSFDNSSHLFDLQLENWFFHQVSDQPSLVTLNPRTFFEMISLLLSHIVLVCQSFPLRTGTIESQEMFGSVAVNLQDMEVGWPWTSHRRESDFSQVH
jgi:hypothetical protein